MEDTRVPPLHPEKSSVRLAMLEKFQALQKKRLEVATKPKDDLNKKDQAPAKSASKRKLLEDVDSAVPTKAKPSGSSTQIREEDQAKWNTIKSYLDVNAHLKGIDRGRHAPKTKLEEEIDEAVAKGDLEKAERLSDQLSNRDFGKKIADAIDASKYDKEKQKEEMEKRTKKKKKLTWGFDHKERWEMKGNM